jgi:hypothetical protein
LEAVRIDVNDYLCHIDKERQSCDVRAENWLDGNVGSISVRPLSATQ